MEGNFIVNITRLLYQNTYFLQEFSEPVSIKKLINNIFLAPHTSPCDQSHSLCPENT